MSSKAKKTIKSRLTPAQIRPLIENFERQDHSIKDFCQRYGISEVTFYNWRKKYGIKPNIDNAGFIEIIPAVASCEPITEKLFAQVRGINIYHPVSAEYLKSLLA
ncbi:IS66 family insertion sequence element accessory protein TnpA [Chitinophaga sancti]|uniref:Transposase n=1 Tax=Chitinophaga sancti TaxID=1004 RepID=A0A1K1SM92_9BACT|nr:transposase [Chitinophaga sancti]WQD65439.1 transposase [Chitinophaga sancti]WQG88938.1 transposase [Chitinophaga sancti]SFW84997.1 Transposase [Chitinophaga sancti]